MTGGRKKGEMEEEWRAGGEIQQAVTCTLCVHYPQNYIQSN